MDKILSNLSLLKKFLILSFIVLVVLGFFMGTIISKTIEDSKIKQDKTLVADHLIVHTENYLSPQAFTHPEYANNQELFSAYSKTIRTPNIVRIKVFNREGTIIYSDEPKLIGKNFAENLDLQKGFKGEIVAEIYRNLERQDEHLYESGFRGLMELYIPIDFGDGEVDGVIEVYHILDPVDRDIRNAKRMIWGVIILGFLFLFFALYGIVKDASDTISHQNKELRDYSGHLEDKVKKRTSELHVANDGLLRNIEKRKLVEVALSESKEKYKTLIESSSDCICHIDLEGRFVYMNRGGVKLNELESPSDLLGKECTTGIKEKYKGFMEDALERARKGETVNLEYESVNAKGGNLWWESIVGPIKDSKGNVVSLIRISRDVTERKLAEAELEKYSKDLEESNKLKDLFIDIMRHDLLNPAGTTRNMAELALKEEEAPEKKEMLDIILETSKRVVDMIENASLFAKLESGETLEIEETDLGIVLRKAAKEMTSLADERKMKIKVSADGEFKALANPLIYDVFSNLINNAIKYGPKNSEVLIGIKGDTSIWKISVADNGRGIPDKYKEAVFERFKRIKKGSVKGSGLGLAIVKNVVETHNGRVWVEDNPCGGSIFYTTLPRLKQSMEG